MTLIYQVLNTYSDGQILAQEFNSIDKRNRMDDVRTVNVTMT